MKNISVKICCFLFFLSLNSAFAFDYEMANGVHILADFYECSVPEDTSELEAILRSAAKASGSKDLEFAIHKFDPCGVSAVLILAESHISVHSWPEHKCAAVDVYTCGQKADTAKAIDYLKTAFSAGKVVCTTVHRGMRQP